MKHPRFVQRHQTRRLALSLLAVPSCLAACLMLAGTAAPASAGTAAPASSRAVAPVAPRPVQAARYGALRYLTSASRVGHAGPGVSTFARTGGQASSGGAGTAGTVVLSGSPGFSAVNPKTDTVYVAIQCVHTDCLPGPPEHVVDIVNTAKCNGKDHSGCRVTGTIRVGTGPLGVAVDPRTDTIYVTNGNDNTVSVINGARCNAQDHQRLRHGGRRHDQGGHLPGRGCVQPGHPHGLRREPDREHLGHQRRHLQRHDNQRLRPPGQVDTGQARPGLDRHRPGNGHGVCGRRRNLKPGRHGVGDQRADLQRAHRAWLPGPGNRHGGREPLLGGG